MAAKFYFLIIMVLSLTGFYYPMEGAQNTKIKAIVFDFGGVIAKTDRQQVAAFIAKSFNMSQEEGMKSLEGLKENSQNDGIENDYWQSYAKSKGKKLPDDWLKQLNEVRLNALEEIPGMIELVKCLKKQGYQTALLSNVRKSQAQIKRKLGFYDLFHPTILSYEVGIRKPDPKSYHLILDKLNLPPEAVIFIDNKAQNVVAAKSIGMDGILFENPDQLNKALKERGIMCTLPDEPKSVDTQRNEKS